MLKIITKNNLKKDKDWSARLPKEQLLLILFFLIFAGVGGHYLFQSFADGVSAPVNSSLPTISGTNQEGQVQTASSGTWTNSPTNYTYQWYDCDAVGNNCSTISGAVSEDYTPTSSDLGDTEYVAVTATNTGGSSTIDSGLSPAIGVPTWNPGSTANLWVNTTAGSCTRNTTPAAYNSSAACGSFQAAYSAAHCGDTIEIEPGSYDTQDLNDVAALDSCTASPVLIEGASTSNPPVIGSVLSTDGGAGASNYILEGIDQTASSCTEDNNAGCDVIFLAGGKNVYFNQIMGGNITLLADSHVLVENSTFGPCFAGPATSGDCAGNMKIDNGWVNCSGANCSTSDVTYRNNTFQKFLANNSDSSQDHFECMFLRGGSEIMIDSNHFHICQLHAIFIQPTDGPLATTIIQNNWFDEVEQSILTPPYYDTSYNASDTFANGVEFGGNSTTEGNNETGIIVRYNSFSPYVGLVSDGGATPAGPNYIYGNIAGVNASCIANATYGYNIFLSGQSTCGTGDTTVSSLPYVNTSYGAEDFHLNSNSIAQSFVAPDTPGYQLTYDKDDNARAANGPRDAGSEASTTPLVGDLNNDGVVNVFDLSILLSHWGQTGSGITGDLNNDGIVNIFDLSILLSHWGQ